MRNREAWLAAIATALGISEEACRRDAAPQVQQVASAASSIAPVVAETAPSASAVASAAPSASGSVASLVKPAPSMTPQQQLMQAICGASVQNQLQNMPANGICGVSVNPPNRLPGNLSCGATVNTGRIPGGGSCGGIGAPPQQQGTRGVTAVVNVSLTGGASGDDHVAASLRPRFRACANQALAQDPSQQGKLVIVAVIAANGEVTNSNVSNNTGLSGSSAQCMARMVRNAQFPAGAVRTITVAIVQTKQSP